MPKQQTERKQARMITMYIPIFKEKLAKLEQRGRGNCEEAQKLRHTIASAENEATSIRGGRK